MPQLPGAPANGEFWLGGPIEGIPPLLMPVAHALLQARLDMRAVAEPLDRPALWTRPHGAASVGFQLLHAAGSLDRLFTYARGEPLSEAQRNTLRREREAAEWDGAAGGDGRPGAAELLEGLDRTVAAAVDQLRHTAEGELLTPRAVGRAQLPSNVLGLLFHGAEHTQRHTGQIIATAQLVRR